MIATPERAEVQRFRLAVVTQLGLQFDDGRIDTLTDVLRQRIEDTACSSALAYLARLDSPPGWRDELRALAERLTVTETYFFRYRDHFRAFADAVLPAFAARPLRILSAGCASGEEPYSLAIQACESQSPVDARIHAIDVNASMIEKAIRGHYSEWALRETPPETQQRRFRPRGRVWALEDGVRRMVSFEERNLVDDDAAFWRPDAFDVVFCRNVIMYFAADVAQAVIARIARSLAPGGFLFLGHAETLRGISQDFHLRHTHDTFYYQRRGALSDAPAAPAPSPDTPVRAILELDGSWVEAIQRASERIAALTGAARQEAPARRAWDLGVAMELLRQERFSEALRALPAESHDDPDAELLRAVLLTNAGKRAEAESVCAGLLERDEFSAGAHYLMALGREHAGDSRAAIDHDQTAAYLDAGFAMPRLHLGLMARRSGDLDAARRELGQALSLLPREDASRILLFGGGFSREALAELCRAEIRACGGAS